VAWSKNESGEFVILSFAKMYRLSQHEQSFVPGAASGAKAAVSVSNSDPVKESGHCLSRVGWFYLCTPSIA
jgi:hypothetical protein